ncbi:uncharacterized protein LOC141832624 [Curcuma longa]|uniref:uncharacterized protein LOC141832624 n=1 Tax=Curcuma longa TaxID=136217 RepID=UPI003D9F806C
MAKEVNKSAKKCQGGQIQCLSIGQKGCGDPLRVGIESRHETTSGRSTCRCQNPTPSIIASGPTDGDSNRSRKAHGRRLEMYNVNTSRPSINFGPQDLEGVTVPHNDALVIRATIVNYDVAWDTRSDLWDKSGLSLSLGEEPLRRTCSTLFIMVDTPSAYNVILGRSALNSFGAVVSTFHQKLKFSVFDQVGSVNGDQSVSRKCYIDMVQADL